MLLCRLSRDGAANCPAFLFAVDRTESGGILPPMTANHDPDRADCPDCPDWAECALLIVGHGSTVTPDSGAPTRAHADAIRRRGVFGEVHAAFWKEEPGVREVLDAIGRREIYVVPNFISEGYFTRRVIPRELGLPAAHPPRTPFPLGDGRTLRYCEPAGNHARMTEMLLRRAAAAAPGVAPGEATLLIVGHGTERHGNSGTAAREQARRIGAMGLYAETLCAYLDEVPRIDDWAGLATSRQVVVVPFFISDGLHGERDIPARLGLGGEAALRNRPHPLRGRELYYAHAIGSEPLLAEILLDQAAAFDRPATP